MQDIYEQRLKKEQILTVPNLLSFLRIALIPLIVYLYLVSGLRYAAAGVVALSALTDVVDGWIARRFRCVTDFGKLIDPLADKLTQASLAVCLLSRYPYVLGLLALLVVKEIFQFVCGYRILKRENRMHSSRWFGKVNTVVFYTVMLILFVFPDLTDRVAYALIGTCVGFLLLSAIGYGRFYYGRGAFSEEEAGTVQPDRGTEPKTP